MDRPIARLLSCWARMRRIAPSGWHLWPCTVAAVEVVVDVRAVVVEEAATSALEISERKAVVAVAVAAAVAVAEVIF